MRMWMVDPKIMCRQHLLGEHLELHMFANALKEGKKLDGFIRNNCLEPASICSRHEDLVCEMENRGYNHKTPLELNIPLIKIATIDRSKSFLLLIDRCERCRSYYHSCIDNLEAI